MSHFWQRMFRCSTQIGFISDQNIRTVKSNFSFYSQGNFVFLIFLLKYFFNFIENPVYKCISVSGNRSDISVGPRTGPFFLDKNNLNLNYF